MIKPLVSAFHIKKIYGTGMMQADDLVAVEEPLEIRVEYGQTGRREQRSIAITMRTPGNDFELATGFLFTEGIIRSFADVLSIRYCSGAAAESTGNIVRVGLAEHVIPDLDKLQRNFYMSSSCGICGKASIEAVRTISGKRESNGSFKISRDVVFSLPEKLRAKQKVFEHTGGLHASALFDTDGNLLLLREDVGRHNALDKLIGAALRLVINEQMMMDNKILLLSGRISFELVQKAAMAGIPVICAVGAPSSLAVEMASECGISLAGFVRDIRFNIYCGEERFSL